MENPKRVMGSDQTSINQVYNYLFPYLIYFIAIYFVLYI